MAASLSIRGLSKSYPGKSLSPPLTVLESIDLDVAAGSIVSIVGLNGSGKTTLLRIIAGLESPDAGSVLIDNQATTGVSRKKIGMVFQEMALLPWRTVRQNIALGLELAGPTKMRNKGIVNEFINAFELRECADKYPKELSGGMRQKVAIARTLAPEPDVVLMDEPFSALDCRTKETMHAFLLKIWTRRKDTILFVTHNIEEAVNLSDRIVVISPTPSRTQEVFSVNMTRPRDKTGLQCNVLRRRIITLLDSFCQKTKANYQ
jgi:NitT/TauT family transport system ATP-binding protein